jgi:hypothetical protein
MKSVLMATQESQRAASRAAFICRRDRDSVDNDGVAAHRVRSGERSGRNRRERSSRRAVDN